MFINDANIIINEENDILHLQTEYNYIYNLIIKKLCKLIKN